MGGVGREDGRVPIYDYACLSCHEPFEELCRSDAPAPACPACASEQTERRLSSFATPNARGGKRSLVAAPGGAGGSCCGGGCGH